MSTTKVVIQSGDKPPRELLDEARIASKRPIVIDEESPEFSKEQLREMAEKAKEKREREKKQVVAIRIAPKTLELAKATGKGYTGFLSRLLDYAINDPELVKKALM